MHSRDQAAIVRLFPIEFGCVTMLLLGSNPQAGMTEEYSRLAGWLAGWLDVYHDAQIVPDMPQCK